MVLEGLREQHAPRPLIIDFNPWQIANREGIGEAFFDEIGIALGKGEVVSGRKRKRLLNRLRRYATRLKCGGTLLRVLVQPIQVVLALSGLSLLLGRVIDLRWFYVPVGLALLAVAVLLWLSKSAYQVVAFLAAGVETDRKNLSEIKSELATELQGLVAPVLVVMDDVDRLTPGELQEVFQLVKANGDLPNLVYLLLFERDVIEKHIQEVMKVRGCDYLEKIAQVAFDIPAIERRRVHQILSEGLDALIADGPVSRRFDQRRWGNIFVGALQHYFQTLRDVNRFLSTLAFQVSIFKGQGAFEVNPVDLIALEVLRVFEPRVYQTLPSLKAALTETHESRHGRTTEEIKQSLANLIGCASEATRPWVQEIVKQLFQPAEWVFGGMHYPSDFAPQWFRELRVCSKDAFDRYFHLTIPLGDVSQAVLEAILANASDRSKLRSQFAELRAQGLLDVALDRLEAYKQAIDISHADAFVTALFDVGDGLRQGLGFFEISPARHAQRIIYWYLKQDQDMESRATALLRTIEATDGLILPVSFVSLIEPREPPAQEASQEEFIPAHSLKAAKDLCVAKIVAAASDGRLATCPDLTSLLFRWRDWAGPNDPRAFCAGMISDPKDALRFIQSFVRPVTTQGMGDRVPQLHPQIRTKELEAFVSLEGLDAVLEAVRRDALSAEDQGVLDVFAKAMERRRKGVSDDSPIALAQNGDWASGAA
jgi:predicted KAP-like P-loop ATPase